MNTSNIIKSIKTCIARFKKLNIIVFGDVILDVYLQGEVKRVSPEAPVPILNTKESNCRLGGGGNVACNLANMGVNVFLVSVIGKDKNGTELLEYMKKSKLPTQGMVVTSKRKTSVKTRVIAQSQQIVRIDDEDTHIMEDAIQKRLLDKVKQNKAIDGIIISDYGKGVVNRKTLEELMDYARSQNLYVALDPKQRNFDLYRDIDVMTPNHHEAAEDIGRSCETLSEIKSIGRRIMDKHNLQQLIITRGEKGMTLFDNTGSSSSPIQKDAYPKIYNLPTFNRTLYDVSGAGDTVIALYTAAYLSSRDSYLAAIIANISAGIVVSHFGTSPVTKEDFLVEIKNTWLLKKIMGNHYE